jgi:hypothetical protein
MDTIKDIVEVITNIVVSIGVFIAYFGFKNELKKQREEKEKRRKEEEKQTEIAQLSFFSEYTKRYQKIVLNLPENQDDIEIFTDEHKRWLRVYFDLCSEEYFLKEEGYINIKVWNEWEEGMKNTFGKKAILAYWQERKISYKEFNQFVENKLITK